MARAEEVLCEGVRMDRAADDEALDLFAAFGGEEQFLGFGFHAFGDYSQLHAAAQGDDGTHDGDVGAAKKYSISTVLSLERFREISLKG